MKSKHTKSIRLKFAVYAAISMLAALMTDLCILKIVKLFMKQDILFFFKEAGPFSKGFILWGMIIFTILIFTIYFLMISYDTVQYLRQIIYGIDQMTQGDWKTEIPLNGDDELSLIADSINELCKKVREENARKQEAEETKDELITNVAHDLRTPLTSILGYLELVRREELLTPEQKKKYIEIVYDKSKQLETLIKELFDYTRYDHSKIKIQMMTLNLPQFMEQIVEEFYPGFMDAHLKCVTHISQESFYVSGDGDLLARAVGNLISNAIKYGKDGKQVIIHTTKKNKQAVIQVINFGKIIPKEDLEKIFDKFYRVEGSRSLKTGGTGLGLAIAKNIVMLHHGEIHAKSDREGTMFEIVLPIEEREGHSETVKS